MVRFGGRLAVATTRGSRHVIARWRVSVSAGADVGRRLAARDSRQLAPGRKVDWVFYPIDREDRRLVGDSFFDRVCVAEVGRRHLDRRVGRKARRAV